MEMSNKLEKKVSEMLLQMHEDRMDECFSQDKKPKESLLLMRKQIGIYRDYCFPCDSASQYELDLVEIRRRIRAEEKEEQRVMDQ